MNVQHYPQFEQPGPDVLNMPDDVKHNFVGLDLFKFNLTLLG